MYRQWIRALPDEQQVAIIEAGETAALSKVRRALRLLQTLEQKGPRFEVELLSSQNLEPVLPYLQFALSCLPSEPQLQLAPLDDIEGYVARPAESDRLLHARVVIWRVEEVLPEVLFPLSHGFPDQLLGRIEQVLERVERLVSLHRKFAPGVPLFISTLPLPSHLANRLFSSQHEAGALAAIARINSRIYNLAGARGGVHVLDVADWAATQGAAHADVLLEMMARQPWSATGQLSFGFFLARSLRPLLVPRRKALALDLDNTLWGGVIAEDDIEGLVLSHDFPGNVHLRIQRELLELRNRGILLVLLSKNNEADAKQGFDSHPEMILKWEDFVVRKVDWNHKHENLRDAAAELKLGLDSFVFLDDSDYEREQMRQAIPEVLILNESGDPLQILRALWETDAFESLTLTEEDRQRHHDYSVRAGRNVEGHNDDLEGFLRSLEMEVTIEQIEHSNLERVVTMLSKTNQFNLTTRRHSRAEVQRLLEQQGAIGLALRLRDKFGDQGIVAVLLAVPVPEEGTLSVDSFLVSCRALGRGVEDALWSAMLEEARRHTYHRVEAAYFASAKNQLVANFYDRLGFRRDAQNTNAVRYVLDRIETAAFPPWIARSSVHHAE